ncbi:hypothetical protein TSOC_014252 [Tetrabaena socialis]|uniref:DUF218 domain-containing protein n=1 Tax=Tetrabaena socialis TaxID=47790 RepID=A0A2J7ZI71_9CHLO|nr:hypothetical protein TSOC_014252 [Tetrabaena socialis]|eukprot:PNG99958.1 hypothetical protein TSOC_014252 [Tetrabaena socialis]
MIPISEVHSRHHQRAHGGSDGGFGHGASGFHSHHAKLSLVQRRWITRGLRAALALLLGFSLYYFLGRGSAESVALRRNRKLLEAEARSFIPAATLKNLVLVAGHAVYTGVDYAEASKESSWFLEEYQKVKGEAQSFLDHIRLGIEEAAVDPEALLLFSGGQTRRAAGPRSEGLSYWVVAEAAEWFGHPEVRNRTFTEEHARDSFENLLFSLCRFYELAGHYPETITVVSYTLKEARFRTLHRDAVRWPLEYFRFVGTPVPPDAIGAKEGEARTVSSFAADPYGCGGELLAKRLHRDPFAVGAIHPSRCPEMRALLAYCGPDMLSGHLPWTS